MFYSQPKVRFLPNHSYNYSIPQIIYKSTSVQSRQNRICSVIRPRIPSNSHYSEWGYHFKQKPVEHKETERSPVNYKRENISQLTRSGERSYYAHAQNSQDLSKLKYLSAMSIPSSHSSNSAHSVTNTTTSIKNANFAPKNPNSASTANRQPIKPCKAFTMMPSVTSRLKKNISRTKEKILQGIGKTDRTADESFDLYVDNFEKQHIQAAKLTKELNRYLTSLKETQRVSKNFYDALRETYEPNWPDHQDFANQTDIVEQKWSDYILKLVNDVQMPLISYLNEFPELKKKIEKRDNRLLDFDNARHNLQGITHKTNKKNNNSATLSISANPSAMAGAQTGSSNTSSSSTEQLTKLTKLKIDLEDKQHVYEEINQTLCMTLPVLFENRIKFYSSLFQTFFYTEATFHSDCVELKTKLDTICEKLSTQTKQQISNSAELYYAKICQDEARTNGFVRSPELPGFSHDSDEVLEETSALAETNPNEASTMSEPKPIEHLPAGIDYIETTYSDNDTEKVYIDKVTVDSAGVSSTKAEFLPEIKRNDLNLINNPPSPPEEYDPTKLESIESFLNKHLDSLANLDFVLNKKKLNEVNKCNGTEVESISSVVSNSKPENEDQIKLLYRVKAMYAYQAKELDELTFAKDDILSVVEGTESENEDLDEGWCIGIHDISLKRGLFPANFTKKI